MAIRIIIADDHAFLRTMLRDRLTATGEFEVVGLAKNGLEAVALCGQLQPDVALLDITMPEMDGLTALPLIREVAPDTRCLVLSMHEGQEMLRAVLLAGGVGYVVKSASEATILQALRKVAAGHSFIDVPVCAFDALSDVVSEPPSRPAGMGPDREELDLTEQEQRLICLVGLGHTNKEIAARMELAVKTIEAHRSRLMSKLGLKNRAELVRYAMRSGLLRPEAAG